MSLCFISNVCIRPGKLYYNDVVVLVREWIWNILERGLEAEGRAAVPPEALGCLVFELPKI